MSVRSALGASRLRLTRQLLTESLVLSAAGGSLGLIVARWAIEPLLALTTLPRATEISLDWRVFAATVSAAILTGVAIGTASAFTAARADMRDALANRGAARTGWLRPTLLVVEVAVTVVLLAGAGC